MITSNQEGRVGTELPAGAYTLTPAKPGWTFDPDSTGRSLQVGLFEGNRQLALITTSVSRPDVNQAFHITGTHGFSLSFTAPFSASFA